MTIGSRNGHSTWPADINAPQPSHLKDAGGSRSSTRYALASAVGSFSSSTSIRANHAWLFRLMSFISSPIYSICRYVLFCECCCSRVSSFQQCIHLFWLRIRHQTTKPHYPSSNGPSLSANQVVRVSYYKFERIFKHILLCLNTGCTKGNLLESVLWHPSDAI